MIALMIYKVKIKQIKILLPLFLGYILKAGCTLEPAVKPQVLFFYFPNAHAKRNMRLFKSDNLKKTMSYKRQNNSSGQAYREYIQFLNEFNISYPISILFLLTSSIVILADLLLQLDPDTNFIKDLSYLGISSLLFEMNAQSSNFALFVNICVVGMLLAPIYAAVAILFWSKAESGRSNGLFKQAYQKSKFNNSIRTYLACFPYIFLPIFTSYGAKILSIDSQNRLFGILIIGLALFNCFIVQYHIFQLGCAEVEYKKLVSFNYPYHLVDDGIVLVGLLVLNITSGLTAQIVGMVATLLRVVLTFYIPFFNAFYQKFNKFILIAAFVASFGLLISYFNKGQYYTLIFAAIMILFLIKTKIEHSNPAWLQLQPSDEDQGIKAIKKRLYSKGMFARSFRDLIFLGRKNNSHRNLLQIEILKSKCSSLQKLNRGGARICYARDVIEFEEKIVKCMQNFLIACELSVSILKFTQMKEGRNQVLAKAVKTLIGLLIENKSVVRQLFETNEYSTDSRILLIRTYSSLYNDSSFMREAEKWTAEHVQLGNQKEIKQKLFNDKSAVIYINVLEEIGKVVKISKNLPSVLGYESNNLIGLSINEIIPFSVKPFHDQNLLQFVQNYANRLSKSDRHFKFYAYNKDFHLQEVGIGYNWIMSDFNTFLMAGILEKIQSENHVILMDQFGNLEGWTKKIGSEEFNLDELSISQRKKYNIMPLFPTLIKYMDSLGVSLRTLFFKNSKARDSNLIIDCASASIAQIQPKLLASFKKILKDEEIVGVCFADIEFSKLSLCKGRVNMWKLQIKQFQRIENISQICGIIQRFNADNTAFHLRSEQSLQSMQPAGETSEKQQASIFSEDNLIIKRLDSNFSLVHDSGNSIAYEELLFGQVNISKTSFEIGNIYMNHLKKKGEKEERMAGSPSAEAGFNPTLQRNSSLFWYVLAVTLAFLLLYALNLASLISAGSLFSSECNHIVQRNIAASIYLKSIFNPNSSYVSRLANGSLMQNMDYLQNESFSYHTFLGDTITLNKYYLFNTQIPATLQRLISSPIIYSNRTANTIPPTSYDYYTEITSNYLNVVSQFDRKFNKTLEVWSGKMGSIRSSFFLKLVFLSLCSAAYAFLLLLLRVRETANKQTLQAFFKFEKEDLERKITAIGALVREMETQAAEMNLLKEFGEVVKREQIENVEFNLIKNQHQLKIKFPHDLEAENKIEKKKYYIAVVMLLLFLLAQTSFLLLHSLTTLQTLTFYQSTPADLDNAAKLIVYPNYLLADLYLPLPASLRTKYDALVNSAVASPIASIPSLYNFLGNVPCPNCSFMYPVLSTNYKSFYSTFLQRVTDMKISNTTTNAAVKDLFLGADYVIQAITPILLTISYSYFQISIVAYLIAMVILCAYMYLGTSSVNNETEKLEVFLKFFTEETITKNKHMNRLFTNIA